MLAELGTIVNDNESQEDRYLHERMRTLIAAEMIRCGAAYEVVDDVVRIHEGFFVVEETMSNLSGPLKRVGAYMPVKNRKTGLDLVKNAPKTMDKDPCNADDGSVGVAYKGPVIIGNEKESSVAKKTDPVIAKEDSNSERTFTSPKEDDDKNNAAKTAPVNEQKEESVDHASLLETENEPPEEIYSFGDDDSGTDSPDTEEETKDGSVNEAHASGDDTAMTFNADNSNAEDVPGDEVYSFGDDNDDGDDAAQSDTHNSDVETPGADNTDALDTEVEDESEKSIGIIEEETFSFGPEEDSGDDETEKEAFAEIDIDGPAADDAEVKWIPKTIAAVGRQNVFRAKSDKVGDLFRDIHELRIPSDDGILTLTVYVYPTSNSFSDFLIAVVDADRNVTGAFNAREGINEIVSGSISLGVNISVLPEGFESDIRMDVIGSSDDYTADRMDASRISDFRKTVEGLTYFVVPFDKSNMGRSKVPVVGTVSNRGKTFPLVTTHSGEIRFRASGVKFTIRGVWADSGFTFDVQSD